MNTIVFFVAQGGFTAQLLVMVFISLVLLSIERGYSLYISNTLVSEKVLKQVFQLIVGKKYVEALQAADTHPSCPQLNVIKKGLLAAEGGREALKSSIGGEMARIGRQINSRVSYLALIASAATLLGLLGTISGLIKTFAGMASLDTSQKAVMLGQGISEAMYSTGAGLIVGLIAMVIHTIINHRVMVLKAECRRCGYDLIKNIEKAERKNG